MRPPGTVVDCFGCDEHLHRGRWQCVACRDGEARARNCFYKHVKVCEAIAAISQQGKPAAKRLAARSPDRRSLQGVSHPAAYERCLWPSSSVTAGSLLGDDDQSGQTSGGNAVRHPGKRRLVDSHHLGCASPVGAAVTSGHQPLDAGQHNHPSQLDDGPQHVSCDVGEVCRPEEDCSDPSDGGEERRSGPPPSPRPAPRCTTEGIGSSWRAHRSRHRLGTTSTYSRP